MTDKSFYKFSVLVKSVRNMFTFPDRTELIKYRAILRISPEPLHFCPK